MSFGDSKVARHRGSGLDTPDRRHRCAFGDVDDRRTAIALLIDDDPAGIARFGKPSGHRILRRRRAVDPRLVGIVAVGFSPSPLYEHRSWR